jgi:hypothetical protein
VSELSANEFTNKHGHLRAQQEQQVSVLNAKELANTAWASRNAARAAGERIIATELGHKARACGERVH